MRLLLDTHALLWFMEKHPKLSAVAQALMTDPANLLLLSPASFWELAIKVSVGKLTLADPYQLFIDQAIADLSLDVLPITTRHTAALIGMPFHHRDPFDRLLVAQALAEGIPIVSGDPALDPYGVTRLW
jgi:PIN domain nuclease of toxin-antitoxin system